MGRLVDLGLLRARTLSNAVRGWREHSRLKLALIFFCAAVFWFGLFALFLEGFRFMGQMPDLKAVLVGVLFALFFMALGLMLTFSNGIIAFTSLFRSEETQYLFTCPLSARRIFLYKLSEGIVFSSWAFMFLGMPLLVAYGMTSEVAWYFYPVSMAFFGAFVFIPAGLGAIAALVMAAYFARNPKRVLVVGAVVVLLIGVVWATGLYHEVHLGRERVPAVWMRDVLNRLFLAQNPLLPSYWVSGGIVAVARGETGDALFYFLLVLSNALFIMKLASGLAARIYSPAYNTMNSLGRRGKRHGRLSAGLDWLLWHMLFPFGPRTRLLLAKDLKTFRRDPVQWSQVLIFFGLLGVYLLNMRNFNYHITAASWRNLVSFLNLTATSLTLSTFTGRFIFPLLSLEGSRFWLLGLFPLKRREILLAKFYFAFIGSLVISETLMLISDLMLDISWQMMSLHSLAVLLICVGLSGISVGMGATFPNLRESNPSKIVAGFGGTLNLILSMVYVGLVVVLFALPCHLYLARSTITAHQFAVWIACSIALALVLALLACWIPLRMGIRAFDRLEP